MPIARPLLLPLILVALTPSAFAADVTVKKADDTFTLANGVVTATVSARNGGLMRLVYRDLDVLHPDPRHASGYWSHMPGGNAATATITLDPASNHGERGEVAVKAAYTGTPIGGGPGGSTACDVEIRYCLGRGDSGIYAYTIFTHKPDYPATSIGEARFCAKLNDAVFDWMTVDANRNRLAVSTTDWNHGEVLNMKEARRITSGPFKGQVEHKYDYTALQFDNRAFGWSSTTKHVGAWIVNPSVEYLSGGPTKVEFLCHRDATFTPGQDKDAPPCMLNYWRSSHYGGSNCSIVAGEAWTKVVGPFLIYCNAGATPDEMWKDALAVAKREEAAWPYGWVASVDYPLAKERATVSGQISLADPQAKSPELKHLLVGLAAPDYKVAGRRGETDVDWQLDAKRYQFWTRAEDDGRFTIPAVRPGRYTLHAIADNVLGEFAKADVTVAAGQPLDLGKLTWTPVRYGRQLWEIGVPDRTAAEFRHGDHYWQWGLYNEYPKDFPDDVTFTIGKSDPRVDWNYAQCPRADRPQGTPWRIVFDLPEAPHGKATLRLAFAATSAKHVVVTVNDQPAGDSGPLIDTAVIRRDGIRGYWYERPVAFDASLFKAGTNTITLTIPPGYPTNGVEYDYLRLELADK